MRGLIHASAGLAMVLFVLWNAPLKAQAAKTAVPAGTAAAAGAETSSMGFWEFMVAGGTVGWVIVALSLAATALAVELLLFLRGTKVIPPGLGEAVQEALRRGKIAEADQQCKLNDSVLARVLTNGMQELDVGWNSVEKQLEDTLGEEGAKVFRRIEYLSIIGNVAPMLGLLGTVQGMIIAFKQVAETQGAARAADLAGGIYLALVTTVQGLVVAIPSLMVYAYLRGRTEEVLARTGHIAHQVFLPLRKARAPQPTAKTATPGATG